MKKIRIGIIGAGWAARQHLGVIRALDGMEAAGIVSRTRTKAEALAREFGIPVCADDLAGLVRTARPDGLMVLVSADQMPAVITQALPYRLPLFAEKPPALTCADTARLADLARETGTPTMVGFNRRYYSIFHQGLEVIRRHGRLRGVTVEGHERMWRIRDGGKFSEEVMAAWIFANSTHTIDLLRFFGGDVESLAACAQARLEKNGDQFAAVMRLSSGAIGQYQAFWYSPGGWSVRLYGDGVTVVFQPLEKGCWIDRDFQTHDLAPDPADQEFKGGFYGQMKAFADLIRTGRKAWPLADLEDALRTMRLAEGIARGRGMPVPLKEDICVS